MNKKQYDLEKRTLNFSKLVIKMCRKVFKDHISRELTSQVVRSGCSVGANYREASESLSKKDLVHRLRISRKECKETTYWLVLMKESNIGHADELNFLIDESRQIRNILSSIIQKVG